MAASPRTVGSRAIIASAVRAELRLSEEELAAAAGISRTRLVRLIRLGLVGAGPSPGSEFLAEDAARLKRMLRLHRDLGVNLIGSAIIVDLLERLERQGQG
jgi:hypothetical protein